MGSAYPESKDNIANRKREELYQEASAVDQACAAKATMSVNSITTPSASAMQPQSFQNIELAAIVGGQRGRHVEELAPAVSDTAPGPDAVLMELCYSKTSKLLAPKADCYLTVKQRTRTTVVDGCERSRGH